MIQPHALLNKTILITRPKGRELSLSQRIKKSQGHVIHYPVISIKALNLAQEQKILQIKSQLQNYDIAIFISPTAVEKSLNYFPRLPKKTKIAAIGSKTSAQLLAHKLLVDINSTGFNSEALLNTNALQKVQVNKKNILIFRGVGGRALLGDTLKKRGAKVTYAQTYQRCLPNAIPLTTAQIESIDAITLSSYEGLKNFLQLSVMSQTLKKIPVIVPSEKARMLAKEQAFRTVVLAKNATDDAMHYALLQLF